MKTKKTIKIINSVLALVILVCSLSAVSSFLTSAESENTESAALLTALNNLETESYFKLATTNSSDLSSSTVSQIRVLDKEYSFWSGGTPVMRGTGKWNIGNYSQVYFYAKLNSVLDTTNRSANANTCDIQINYNSTAKHYIVGKDAINSVYDTNGNYVEISDITDFSGYICKIDLKKLICADPSTPSDDENTVIANAFLVKLCKGQGISRVYYSSKVTSIDVDGNSTTLAIMDYADSLNEYTYSAQSIYSVKTELGKLYSSIKDTEDGKKYDLYKSWQNLVEKNSEKLTSNVDARTASTASSGSNTRTKIDSYENFSAVAANETIYKANKNPFVCYFGKSSNMEAFDIAKYGDVYFYFDSDEKSVGVNIAYNNANKQFSGSSWTAYKTIDLNSNHKIDIKDIVNYYNMDESLEINDINRVFVTSSSDNAVFTEVYGKKFAVPAVPVDAGIIDYLNAVTAVDIDNYMDGECKDNFVAAKKAVYDYCIASPSDELIAFFKTQIKSDFESYSYKPQSIFSNLWCKNDNKWSLSDGSAEKVSFGNEEWDVNTFANDGAYIISVEDSYGNSKSNIDVDDYEDIYFYLYSDTEQAINPIAVTSDLNSSKSVSLKTSLTAKSWTKISITEAIKNSENKGYFNGESGYLGRIQISSAPAGLRCSVVIAVKNAPVKTAEDYDNWDVCKYIAESGKLNDLNISNNDIKMDNYDAELLEYAKTAINNTLTPDNAVKWIPEVRKAILGLGTVENKDFNFNGELDICDLVRINEAISSS